MNSTLILSGYNYNEQASIWIRQEYTGIAYSDGDEVEKRIASIIDNDTDLSVLSDELRPHCTDWPSIYHLSGSRANILRPFESDLRGDILEIGAGCGAITRYLGECGGDVLALEGSPRRAAIARARTRDLGNVVVVSDKFDDFRCDKKFDVVTLIGVLEYANLFTDGENPTLSMLERVRSFLKPNGKLIIAIENQLGLKYFAGAPEDHVGIPMYGIEGRYRNDQPQTFGRKELSGLIENAGFTSTEFMAPFPDYKLPVSIVTERGFSSEAFDAAALASQSAHRDPQLPPILAFSPQLAWGAIAKNGLALDLANSFIIVASSADKQGLFSSNTLAWHFTTERKKELCKVTKFVEVNPKQVEVHYKRIAPNAANPVMGNLLQHFLPERSEYRQGKVLLHELVRVVTRDGWCTEDVCSFFLNWLNFIATLAEELGQAVDLSDPSSQLPGSFFDYIPQNITESNDGDFHVIDIEWVANEKLEIGYIVFRTLWALLHTLKKLGRPANDEIRTYYDLISSSMNGMGWLISHQDIARWVEIEYRIQSEVAGRFISFDGAIDWLKNAALPIVNLSQAVTERDGQIASLSQTVTERDDQIANLSQAILDKDWHINLLKMEIASVLSSRSWRLTAPLRKFANVFWRNGVARIFSRISLPARAFRELLWYLGSNLFRRLPLGIRTKLKIRNIAVRYLGPRPGKETAQEGRLALLFPSVPHPSFPDPSARKPFSFPENEHPLVSVIIPVFNKSDYTYACLRSIYENQPTVSFEIILVDDRSTDDTAELLDKIEGIQVLRNDDNLGFLRSCDRGAAVAVGQYLLFLNNDTLVHPLWMDELVAVLSHRQDIGLVGSQLIYADGRLQESGCLSCQDGSSVPLGRLQSPDHPEFSYFREVDFCSGASILVRKSDFQEVGGFDIAYAPAYYEDPDLAFKLRAAGKKVFVQPLSKVTHFEGISHGEQVYNELVTRNKNIFTNKWALALAKQAYIDVQDFRVNRRYCRERVLYIDALVPVPDRGAGSVDAYYYMQFLIEAGYDVVFYGEHTPDFVPKYTPLIQRIGVECLYRPHVNIEQYLSEYGATFTYVVVARIYQAEVFESLLRKYCPNARYIFNTVDVHFLRESRQAEVENSAPLRAAAQRTQQNELGFMGRADATIVISLEEKQLLEQKYAQERIHHIPLIREVYGCKHPFSKRKDIVFIGSAHLPNVDGILYFHREILPLIRRELPQVRLIVIGEELRDALPANPGFEELSGDASVSLVGFVENLAEYFDHVRLMVAPLRYGSGVKGKIATALSYGVPCVATRIGVEGMGLEGEINVLEGDDPETFAQAVIRAYTDPTLWQRLSKNGLKFMDENYSPSMGKSRLLEVLASTAKDREKRPSLSFRQFTRYQDYVASVRANQKEYEERHRVEMGLTPAVRVPFSVNAFCAQCGAQKPMRVTFDYAHQKDADGQLIPNWREHLVCECGLNNRLRASLHLFKELFAPKKTARIYLTEHVTMLAAWLKRHFLNVTSSEYLGTQVPFGTYNSSGVRNESLTALSFPDGSLDFVLSFDVFEHIPDYHAAFSECYRVLADSGVLFFSVPFRSNIYEHQIRAEMASDGTIRHLLEPEYHGDPVDPNGGVLCYQVFGWQVLDDLKMAGFPEVYAVSFWSREYGYLGGEQILLIAHKRARGAGL